MLFSRTHPRKAACLNESFEHFLNEGSITQVIRPIKAGKEASVHLCRANPRVAGADLVALKVFHPLDRRDFRDEGLYRDGEFIKERRIRTALEKKTKFGRQVQGQIWVDREWSGLKTLAAAGAPVPRPIQRTSDAILMTYIGDEQAAAPQLRSARPAGHRQAADLFEQIMAKAASPSSTCRRQWTPGRTGTPRHS